MFLEARPARDAACAPRACRSVPQKQNPFSSAVSLWRPLLTAFNMMPADKGKMFKGTISIFTEQAKRMNLEQMWLDPKIQMTSARFAFPPLLSFDFLLGWLSSRLAASVLCTINSAAQEV